MQFESVKAVLHALAAEGVEYVLVGGVAIGLHGFERATNDIDLFIRPTEENVFRLRRALDSVFHDNSIEEITAADLSGDFPTIRYGPPDADFVIDILSRLGQEVQYDDLDFQEIDVDGVGVRVATPRTLYRMKRGTLRPIDRIDAEVLRSSFDLGDEE